MQLRSYRFWWVLPGILVALAFAGRLSSAEAPPPSARPLMPGLVVTSTLGAGDELLTEGEPTQRYEMPCTQGQTYTLWMTSEEFDTVLYVIDPVGTLLATDDDGFTDTNSRLTFEAPSTGRYQVLASSYSAGIYGSYRLLAHEGAQIQRSAPIWSGQPLSQSLEPTDLIAFETGWPADTYLLEGIELGRVIDIVMRSAAIDSQLFVVDNEYRILATDDDSAGGRDARVTLPFTPAPQQHFYVVVTSSSPGQYGGYFLQVTDAQPSANEPGTLPASPSEAQPAVAEPVAPAVMPVQPQPAVAEPATPNLVDPVSPEGTRPVALPSTSVLVQPEGVQPSTPPSAPVMARPDGTQPAVPTTTPVAVQPVGIQPATLPSTSVAIPPVATPPAVATQPGQQGYPMAPPGTPGVLQHTGPTPVELDEPIEGELVEDDDYGNRPGPADIYTFTLDEPGVLRLDVESEDFDTVLQVFDREGEMVQENDDYRHSTDSRILAPFEAGVYLVEVSSFDGETLGGYTLVVRQEPLLTEPEELTLGDEIDGRWTLQHPLDSDGHRLALYRIQTSRSHPVTILLKPRGRDTFCNLLLVSGRGRSRVESSTRIDDGCVIVTEIEGGETYELTASGERGEEDTRYFLTAAIREPAIRWQTIGFNRDVRGHVTWSSPLTGENVPAEGFAFEAERGARLFVRVFNTDLDARIVLTDISGTVITSTDDAHSLESTSGFSLTIPSSGWYRLLVMGRHHWFGTFTLQVNTRS